MPCDALKACLDGVLTRREARCVPILARDSTVLLMQMVRAGMIDFAEYAEPSVAPLCIALICRLQGRGKG